MDNFEMLLALSRRLKNEGFTIRSVLLDGFMAVPVRPDGELFKPNSSGGYRPSWVVNLSPEQFRVKPANKPALVAMIRPTDADAIRFLQICNEHGMDPTGWLMWAEDLVPGTRRWSIVLGGTP